MKRQSLKQLTIILISVFLIGAGSSCMLPLANKTYLEHDPNVDAPRVTYENQGTVFLFSWIPTGKPLDIKTELAALKSKQSCRAMKNIDVQYFNYSFYIVGFDKVLIRADCIK